MTPNSKFVLVVEDERALSDAIKLKLVISGFEVIVADSVAGAKAILDKPDKPDIVWLDHYLMGEETGLDLLRYMKSDDNLKGIDVFVASNSVARDKAHEYISLGVKKFYTKAEHKLDEIITDIKTVSYA